jgi:hypothetical protein
VLQPSPGWGWGGGRGCGMVCAVKRGCVSPPLALVVVVVVYYVHGSRGKVPEKRKKNFSMQPADCPNSYYHARLGRQLSWLLLIPLSSVREWRCEQEHLLYLHCNSARRVTCHLPTSQRADSYCVSKEWVLLFSTRFDCLID